VQHARKVRSKLLFGEEGVGANDLFTVGHEFRDCPDNITPSGVSITFIE
jgi:hypothetical protein